MGLPGFDFKGSMVVFDRTTFSCIKKVWGEETVFCNTELYSSRLLTVIPGYKSSLHRHIKKDETLTCLQGYGIVKIDDTVCAMTPGKTVRIGKTKLHSFKSKEGMVLLETSTYNDNVDCDRRKDSGKI